MASCKNLMAAAVGLMILTACGGGDKSSSPTLLAAGASTTVNAEGKIVPLDSNNPPDMTGPAFSTDMKRMRAARLEKWKKGQATTPAKIPEDKKAKRPARLLSMMGTSDSTGAPVAMGETVKVAPSLDTIPVDAATKGAWSKVYDWPLIPIHMTMMPDGRLLSFGTTAAGAQTGSKIYDIYDPSLGLFDGHMTMPNGTGTDIFCSVALTLPATDQVLTVGGDVFDPVSGYPFNKGNNNTTLVSMDNSISRGNNMNLPRWYASTVTMTNGETFVMGGLGGEAHPEIRSTAGVWRMLTADTSRLDYWYPHNWLAPDGRVFGYDSFGNYYYVNTSTGALQIVNQWDVNRFGESGTAVMYRPGQILQLAGYSNAASIIDIRSGTPTLTALPNLPKRRQDSNASVLPNGQVVVTGGSEVYNEQTGVSNQASIWNPDTRAWTQGAVGTMDRLYHSINMLMADGTVLVGGGGAWGPLNNTNVEFYYPPYLFDGKGGMAVRPTISAAPTTASIGQTFNLTVSPDVTRVTMVKSGSVTHSFNNEQNFNELTFTRSGSTLTVNMPTSAINASPGYYMVFALNAAGTPSMARIVKVAPPAPPAVTVNPPTKLTGYTCGVGCWTTDTGVHVAWTKSTTTTVTQYQVRRSTTGLSGPWTTVATLGNVKQWTDKNVTNGTTYYYSVAALVGGTPSVYANLPYSITSDITLGIQPPPSGTNTIMLNSQGETKLMVMNWWRGDPALEGNFRQPGICTGPAPTGNCYLGARKTFRPQGFYIQNSMLWLEVPQYEGTINTFDHYALPIELVKNGCTFMIQHIRTHSRFEFPLNPPGLEILPHTWTMSADLCAGYDPTSTTWVQKLNAAVDAMLGPDPYPYTPPAYPYNDPRTGKDPSQP